MYCTRYGVSDTNLLTQWMSNRCVYNSVNRFLRVVHFNYVDVASSGGGIPPFTTSWVSQEALPTHDKHMVGCLYCVLLPTTVNDAAPQASQGDEQAPDY